MTNAPSLLTMPWLQTSVLGPRAGRGLDEDVELRVGQVKDSAVVLKVHTFPTHNDGEKQLEEEHVYAVHLPLLSHDVPQFAWAQHLPPAQAPDAQSELAAHAAPAVTKGGQPDDEGMSPVAQDAAKVA